MSFMQRVINYGVPAVVIGGLAAGVGARLLGAPAAAAALWTAAIAPALLALLASILRDLLQRRIGVDVIALLAMGGALALDQLLAGAVIAAMYVTGVALEQFAVARAQRELSLLAARAPRIAHRQRDGTVADVPVDEVAVGDHLRCARARCCRWTASCSTPTRRSTNPRSPANRYRCGGARAKP
jgi:cation transport ATPase